jgi:hypothetical protein
MRTPSPEGMCGLRKSRWVLATCMACLACSAPEPDVHVRVVRAGDTATARLTDLELDGGWRLDPVATCIDDGLVEELALDAVAGAALLNRSMMAVGNGRNHNVVLYAEDGAWRTVGRRGTGPGEFESLAWVGRLAGDTGLAYDARLRRVSAFTWHDGVIWTRTIPAPPSADEASIAGVAGSLADRRIIVLAYGPPVHSPGRHRIPLIVYFWDRSSDSLERWTTAAGREIQLIELTGPGVGLLNPLFQLESLVRVAGRVVVLADTENVGLKLLAPET